MDTERPQSGNTSNGFIDPPDDIIKIMYLEINNIAQGINVGLIVLTLANSDLYRSMGVAGFSTLAFAVTSLFIATIFWVRYYFDTEILKRSFTVLSVVWYFAYIVSQGISISLIASATAWMISTAVFLAFGAGFYVLNLLEIRRKQKVAGITFPCGFVDWQRRRMIELFVVSCLALVGAYLINFNSALTFPAALIALGVAVWQMAVTRAYRTRRFINTGI